MMSLDQQAPTTQELYDLLLTPKWTAASVEQRLLWLSARVSLPDATLVAIRQASAALDADGWARVVALARQHGVENLLFTAISAAGVVTSAPGEQMRTLSERYRAVALQARRLDYRLETLLPLLAAADTPVIPLKGTGLARRYYGGVTLRPVTDIDLLVHAKDALRWDAALRLAGCTPSNGGGDPHSGHALRFRELRYHDASGISLEAHLALCRHPAYQRAFPLPEIWERARSTVLNGVSMLTLAPEDELRFLSLHYTVQHRASRLIWLVDVAELLRIHGSAIAWEPLVEHALRNRFAAPLAMTLLPAQAWLDAPVPEDVCAQLHAAAQTAPERRAWADSQAKMDTVRRFLAQRHTLDTVTERLKLLRSGGASVMRRIRIADRRQADPPHTKISQDNHHAM